MLGGYAQKLSDARGLGLRFVTILPKQFVVGTEIAEKSAGAYAAAAGVPLEKYLERFGTPLLPEGVAEAIVRVLGAEPGLDRPALAVTGKGVEAVEG